MCPLDVVAVDIAPRSPGLASKFNSTLLMILSRSSSDLAVESASESSTYLLSEGRSAIVLAVEFESFPGRRREDRSQSGPVFEGPWLRDRSRGVGVSDGLDLQKNNRTMFTKKLLTVAGVSDKIFSDPRYSLLPWGLLQFRTSTRSLQFLDR